MKNMRHTSLKKSRGISLPEVLLGLAVSGLVAVFVYSFLPGILDSQKSDQFKILHGEMITKISNFFAPNYDYSTISNTLVNQGRLAPVQMLNSTVASPLRTAYGSASASIFPVTGRADLFAVAYSGLPKSQCATDVAGLAARATVIEFKTITAAHTITASSSVKDLTNSKDLDRAALTAACAGAGSTYSLVVVQQ